MDSLRAMHREGEMRLESAMPLFPDESRSAVIQRMIEIQGRRRGMPARTFIVQDSIRRVCDRIRREEAEFETELDGYLFAFDEIDPTSNVSAARARSNRMSWLGEKLDSLQDVRLRTCR